MLGLGLGACWRQSSTCSAQSQSPREIRGTRARPGETPRGQYSTVAAVSLSAACMARCWCAQFLVYVAHLTLARANSQAARILARAGSKQASSRCRHAIWKRSTPPCVRDPSKCRDNDGNTAPAALLPAQIKHSCAPPTLSVTWNGCHGEGRMQQRHNGMTSSSGVRRGSSMVARKEQPS